MSSLFARLDVISETYLDRASGSPAPVICDKWRTMRRRNFFREKRNCDRKPLESGISILPHSVDTCTYVHSLTAKHVLLVPLHISYRDSALIRLSLFLNSELIFFKNFILLRTSYISRIYVSRRALNTLYISRRHICFENE